MENHHFYQLEITANQHAQWGSNPITVSTGEPLAIRERTALLDVDASSAVLDEHLGKPG